MKKLLFFYIGLTLLLIIIPIASVMLFGGIFKEENTDEILVYIKNEDRVEKMNKEEYIKGVVAAEMPVEFEKEALKAQAVAARTYLEKKFLSGAEDSHKGAVICTDYTCCQAWIAEDARKEAWEADKRDEYWNKICMAADETAGEILKYNGEIISALFHSTSSGSTEAAEDVWGEHVPYLVSVESKADEQSPKFFDEKQMTVLEFQNKFSEKYPDADLSKSIFEDVKRSEAGGIKTACVYGKSVKGTELRTLFELKSTNMELFVNDENVLIKTKGYGHGVGMSQYGAEFMAREGKDYREILTHYYKGAEIH